MNRAELKKLRVGDKIRIFFFNYKGGVVGHVSAKGKEFIQVCYTCPDEIKAERVYYSFDLIEKIEDGGPNPFISREENGVERALRALKEKGK